jgi:hypothetical protein
MDTAKAANLFVNYPDADMFDFINAPIGKGKPIDRKLSPLVCSKCLGYLILAVDLTILVPTTAVS